MTRYKATCPTVLLLLILWSSPGFAQQSPAIPQELSIAVQSRARELKVWDLVSNDFGFKVPEFPVNFEGGRGWQPLQVFLDQLAAADVMASVRAKKLNRSPESDDYDLMFASWCVFIPNKPPASGALRDVTTTVRNKVLVGMYLSKSKRDSLEKSMRPVLLEGSKADLFKNLAGISRISDYNRLVLDTTQLR